MCARPTANSNRHHRHRQQCKATESKNSRKQEQPNATDTADPIVQKQPKATASRNTHALIETYVGNKARERQHRTAPTHIHTDTCTAHDHKRERSRLGGPADGRTTTRAPRSDEDAKQEEAEQVVDAGGMRGSIDSPAPLHCFAPADST